LYSGVNNYKHIDFQFVLDNPTIYYTDNASLKKKFSLGGGAKANNLLREKIREEYFIGRVF
jgi:hypothetical protein